MSFSRNFVAEDGQSSDISTEQFLLYSLTRASNRVNYKEGIVFNKEMVGVQLLDTTTYINSWLNFYILFCLVVLPLLQDAYIRCVTKCIRFCFQLSTCFCSEIQYTCTFRKYISCFNYVVIVKKERKRRAMQYKSVSRYMKR